MHVASAGFFDVGPDDPDSERAVEVPRTPPWLQPPQDVIPGRVVLDEIVHRGDATLLLVREVRGYPDGVEVRIGWVRRRRGESEREWNAWIHQRLGYPAEPERDDLHVGVRLSDGTRVLPLDLRRAWVPGAELTAPTLSVGQGGGGGGLDSYEGRLNAWLWLDGPATGDLELVFEWLAVGLTETTLRIPAAVLGSVPAPRPMWEDAD